MDNALTVDVEDYYMVSAFADRVRFEDWPKFESRVERNTRRILDLLDEHAVRATFFVLGWVGERHPGLVREIHDRGHEVSCHGYNHRLIYDLTPAEFREDTRRAKGILEDAAGKRVIGYRATSYSVVKRTLWALDVMIEEGFQYDSSIFPVHHDRYGYPGAERFAHVIKRPSGAIVEFPPTTYRLFGQNIPVAGGGYLRLFPTLVTKQPAIFYVHPWEIDMLQPRIKGTWLSELRHYVNLDTTFPKLTACLAEFKFKPLSKFLRHHDGA
jgi:polysaccharide deacetylase family protein (PEP-CTERM system associated)